MKKDKTFRPDRIASYFRVEWLPLALVNTATSEVLVGCNLGAALAPVVLRVIGFCSGAWPSALPTFWAAARLPRGWPFWCWPIFSLP